MPRTSRPKKPKRSFADLLSSYKTYDPELEGYGDPKQWREAFRARMGLEEAQEFLGAKSPREILGVLLTATWAEISRAFKKKIIEVHPDRCAVTGLSQEEAHRLSKEVVAAYSILAEEFGK